MLKYLSFSNFVHIKNVSLKYNTCTKNYNLKNLLLAGGEFYKMR